MDRRTERSVLESISREYVNPDPGRLVDQKIVSMVVDAVASWIDGPDVLEMGLGDDCWTSRVIETVGHSSVVDAADQLLAQAKSKYGDKVTVHRSFFEDFVPDKKYDTVIAS